MLYLLLRFESSAGLINTRTHERMRKKCVTLDQRVAHSAMTFDSSGFDIDVLQSCQESLFRQSCWAPRPLPPVSD